MLAIVSGMVTLRNRRGTQIAAFFALPCIGLAAAGCGSSSPSPSGGSGTKVSGTVGVAYASSLQFLNEKVVGPAFTKAEGYKYSGQGAASGTLSSEIASGEIHPNVFESVGGDNVTPLFPKFTKWYVQYAGTSRLSVSYAQAYALCAVGWPSRSKTSTTPSHTVPALKCTLSLVCFPTCFASALCSR